MHLLLNGCILKIKLSKCLSQLKYNSDASCRKSEYVYTTKLRYLIEHVERMDEYRMARRVLMAEVSGKRVRGRPRFDWMDGVKVALHGQHRNDGGGCALLRERSERV